MRWQRPNGGWTGTLVFLMSAPLLTRDFPVNFPSSLLDVLPLYLCCLQVTLSPPAAAGGPRSLSTPSSQVLQVSCQQDSSLAPPHQA
jgi:hypothetical protein